jgi:hypothetical protein
MTDYLLAGMAVGIGLVGVVAFGSAGYYLWTQKKPGPLDRVL